jgi:hypothetical protein
VNGGGRVPRLAPATAGAEPEGAALRVLLVSRDAMLAEALDALVDEPGEVSMLDWRADGLELALHHADVVVIDVPPSLHRQTFAMIDGRFLGRTVVLLQDGESEEALPPGPSRVVRYRPLQIADLWAAVTGAVHPAATGEAANGAGPGAEVEEPPTAARMIGWSGRALEPAVGPGQIAPGLDPDTLARLRRWHERARTAPTAEPEAPPAAPSGPDGPTARGAPPGWLAALARSAVVVAFAGMVALGAAGWRAEGGPDLLAGEVAAVQAARSLAQGPDLLLPDPRVGQVGPVHALAVGARLRLTGAETDTTLEAAVRAARAPSRALLAVAVALTALLSLLLMRVGPGSGAAAGPGPTPPHPSPPSRASLLGGAAAGLLAAADPLLVRSGRVATATALALLLALATSRSPGRRAGGRPGWPCSAPAPGWRCWPARSPCRRWRSRWWPPPWSGARGRRGPGHPKGVPRSVGPRAPWPRSASVRCCGPPCRCGSPARGWMPSRPAGFSVGRRAAGRRRPGWAATR